MNIYLRNIQNVVRAYGRQVGRRSLLGRPRDPQDKVTISEEGRQRLLEDIARRLHQKRGGVQNSPLEKGRILFKTRNPEGEEILEEISLEKQPELLEKLVEKISEEKEFGHEDR